jgi:hypothetical protein
MTEPRRPVAYDARTGENRTLCETCHCAEGNECAWMLARLASPAPATIPA